MKRDYLYLFLIGSLLLFGLYQTYSKKETYDISQSNILAYNDTIKFYKTAYNQEVASKKSIILEKDNLQFLSDSLNSIVKNFKKVKNIVIVKEVIKIDTVKVPVTISDDNLLSWHYSDDFVVRGGRIFNGEAVLDPIEIFNTQSIVTGQKKNGIFKPKEYVIDISNSNPYIKSRSIQHYTIIDKKQWYEKWWITGPIGIGVGALILK